MTKCRIQAEPGDLMLFFSDGVEDQLNAKEEDFTRGASRGC